MGCFNTVYFDCPHCGERNDEQSKGGSCTLDYKSIYEADPRDVNEVRGRYKCHSCGEHFRVITSLMAHVIKE